MTFEQLPQTRSGQKEDLLRLFFDRYEYAAPPRPWGDALWVCYIWAGPVTSRDGLEAIAPVGTDKGLITELAAELDKNNL